MYLTLAGYFKGSLRFGSFIFSKRWRFIKNRSPSEGTYK